jgi:hypothetical protein
MEPRLVVGRVRRLVGLPILRDLRPSPSEPGVWSGGEIYDPTLGRTFRARLELLDGTRLALRGYVGFELLGRTTTWIRVGAKPRCADARGGAGAGAQPGAMMEDACRDPES